MAASPREIAYLLSIGKSREKTAQFLEFPKEASTRTDSVQPSWPAFTHAEAGGSGGVCLGPASRACVPCYGFWKAALWCDTPSRANECQTKPLGAWGVQTMYFVFVSATLGKALVLISWQRPSLPYLLWDVCKKPSSLWIYWIEWV